MENPIGKPDKINALLDVDRFSGSSEKRMLPVIIFVTISGLPFLIYAGFLLKYCPFYLYLIVQLLWIGRWALIILCDEAERKDQYRKQVNDVYGAIKELLNIRKIHDDGCIEYVDGRINFIIVTFNATSNDKVYRAQYVKRFISSLNEKYVTDIIVHNMVDDEQINKRYESIKMINDPDVSGDFIAMIDNTRRLIREYSMLKATYYILKGRRADYGEMKEELATLDNSRYSHIFKQLYVAGKEEVEKILARDVDMFVDFDEVLMQKYKKGRYYGAKVVRYDDDNGRSKRDSESNIKYDETGFMVKDKEL